jgi:hypothetical protein
MPQVQMILVISWYLVILLLIPKYRSWSSCILWLRFFRYPGTDLVHLLGYKLCYSWYWVISFDMGRTVADYTGTNRGHHLGYGLRCCRCLRYRWVLCQEMLVALCSRHRSFSGAWVAITELLTYVSGVYARVSAAKSWIESKIQGTTCGSS